jgi:hypothetical protein
MPLSLLGICVSLQQPRAYLNPAGVSLQLHLGTHAGASIAVHKLLRFTSSGSTASAPYINRNGVKFVALHIVVLRLQIVVGMTSAQLPFFSPSSIFLIASNINVLALSTAPLD